MRLVLRLLACGHLLLGGLLLLGGGWFLLSALRVLPYMSTGTVWSNLPTALLLGATMGLPFLALGVWLIRLGRRIWSGDPRLRSAIAWTHGALLIPGSLGVIVGMLGRRAAAASAARGGGLLGGLPVLPLVVGACLLLLSITSLLVALALSPGNRAHDA